MCVCRGGGGGGGGSHIPVHKHRIWQITVVFPCAVHKCSILVEEYFYKLIIAEMVEWKEFTFMRTK